MDLSQKWTARKIVFNYLQSEEREEEREGS